MGAGARVGENSCAPRACAQRTLSRTGPGLSRLSLFSLVLRDGIFVTRGDEASEADVVAPKVGPRRARDGGSKSRSAPSRRRCACDSYPMIAMVHGAS